MKAIWRGDERRQGNEGKPRMISQRVRVIGAWRGPIRTDLLRKGSWGKTNGSTACSGFGVIGTQGTVAEPAEDLPSAIVHLFLSSPPSIWMATSAPILRLWGSGGEVFVRPLPHFVCGLVYLVPHCRLPFDKLWWWSSGHDPFPEF